MTRPKLPRGPLEKQLTFYARRPSSAELAVEREVHGVNAGINSYTTPAQADALAAALALERGVRLLDVGAGAGWPGVYLARTTGCSVVLTDVPFHGLRAAAARARRERVHQRCAFVAGGGGDLPFRPHTFDAVVHTDVL